MGLVYAHTEASRAINAAASDHVSLKAGATQSFLMREFQYSGLATASAANEIGVYRTTTGTIATVSLQPFNVAAGAATTRSGVAQATTLGVKIYSFGLNGNGALFRWVAAPGLAVDVVGAGQLGWRGITGTSLATASVIIEEI